MKYLASCQYTRLANRSFTCSTTCLDHRIKTSKERKEHFMNVNSWKANDLNETRHGDHVAEEKRQPKKKVALMLGYNGSAYQGMQA